MKFLCNKIKEEIWINALSKTLNTVDLGVQHQVRSIIEKKLHEDIYSNIVDFVRMELIYNNKEYKNLKRIHKNKKTASIRIRRMINNVPIQ